MRGYARMITKVKDIAKVDAFDSFTWNGSDLKRFNLIYGWNGSGKTTLSRVLNFVERRSIHLSDLTSIDFHLQTTAGAVKAADLTSHVLDVRVFNEDFIRENLVFAEGHAKRIVIIGKENIDIKEQIATLEKEHETRQQEHAKLAKLRAESAKVDSALTDAGRAVTQQFGNTPLANHQYYGRSYNKARVETLIGDGSITEATVPGLILAPNQVDAHRDIIKNERHPVPVSPASIVDFAELFSEASKLVQTPVSVREMAGIENDRELREWVEAGYYLHKKRGSTSCLFCTSGLNASLLDTLAGVFTDELAAIKADIDQTVLRLQATWTVEHQVGIDSGKLFPDIAAKYLASKTTIETESVVVSSAIEALCANLKNKQDHLHDGSVASAVVAYPAASVARINEELGKGNALLEEHNRRVAKGGEEVAAAARAIELHTIAATLSSKTYFATKKVVAALDGQIGPLQQRIDELAKKIGGQRAALHDVGIAVGLINDLLQDFFGKSQLYLEVVDQNGDMSYVLKSRGKNAQRLSEGEKSVLALIYFFVKLEEEGCDKSRSIVVVDDPVDSQDSAFLFQTFGLLKRQLNTACQLIVLTHNFEFFNLVRDWLTSSRVRDDARLFLMSLDKGDTERAVRIDDLPKLLREYKSEYQYLFARLYQHSQGTPLLDAPLVANVGRKVLEYFAAFKWSCKTTEEFTNIVLTRFVADPNLLKKGTGDFIVKFLHEYSHGQNFTRPVSASMFEAKAVTENILSFIRLADQDHYDKLQSLCQEIP